MLQWMMENIKNKLENHNQTRTAQYVITLTQMGSLYRRLALQNVNLGVLNEDLDMVQENIDQKLRTSRVFYQKGITILEENPGIKIKANDRVAIYLGRSWVNDLLE